MASWVDLARGEMLAFFLLCLVGLTSTSTKAMVRSDLPCLSGRGSTHLGDPTREWESAVSREGEEIAGDCRQIADVRADQKAGDHNKYNRCPACRHALTKNIYSSICAWIVQRGLKIWHGEAESYDGREDEKEVYHVNTHHGAGDSFWRRL